MSGVHLLNFFDWRFGVLILVCHWNVSTYSKATDFFDDRLRIVDSSEGWQNAVLQITSSARHSEVAYLPKFLAIILTIALRDSFLCPGFSIDWNLESIEEISKCPRSSNYTFRLFLLKMSILPEKFLTSFLRKLRDLIGNIITTDNIITKSSSLSLSLFLPPSPFFHILNAVIRK